MTQTATVCTFQTNFWVYTHTHTVLFFVSELTKWAKTSSASAVLTVARVLLLATERTVGFLSFHLCGFGL